MMVDDNDAIFGVLSTPLRRLRKSPSKYLNDARRDVLGGDPICDSDRWRCCL